MRGQHSGVHSANRYVSAAVPGGKPICEKIRFRNWARFCEPVGANFIYDIDNLNWTRWLARPRVILGEMRLTGQQVCVVFRERRK